MATAKRPDDVPIPKLPDGLALSLNEDFKRTSIFQMAKQVSHAELLATFYSMYDLALQRELWYRAEMRKRLNGNISLNEIPPHLL